MLTRISYLMTSFLFYKMLLFGVMLLSACNDSNQSVPDPPPTSQQSQQDPSTNSTPGVLQLIFTHDWEKQPWINEATTQFNAAQYKLSDGQTIHVEAIPMISWEIIDEVLSETRQTHLISPASSAFIKLGNTQSRLKMGQDLVGYTENLVYSPLVIALWKPMAKALGWGKQPLGWADILAIAENPQGWAAYNYPQWGHFKLGHPHPEYTNSGLLSLLAQVYAGAHKQTGLTLTDINHPPVGTYLHKIQQTVAYYGHSTRFFNEELHNNGPSYLSAALLYENQVIQSYQHHNPSIPLVAIYPKEGTFWSEHPIGVVERDWVTPAHREAAYVYMDYLLDKPQQEQALQHGFRPTNDRVALTAPLDSAHGIDPSTPKTTLEMPPVEVMQATIKLWYQHKKPANVLLMLDISGSMREDKIRHARQSALQLIETLKDVDYFSLLSFNNHFNWIAEDALVGLQRNRLQQQVRYQFVSGGTALYDAIDHAYTSLLDNPQPDKISTIVVLSDGIDSNSHLTWQNLLSKVSYDSEERPIRIFTINYGSNTENNILSELAKNTNARFYNGTPLNTFKILKEISSFF